MEHQSYNESRVSFHDTYEPQSAEVKPSYSMLKRGRIQQKNSSPDKLQRSKTKDTAADKMLPIITALKNNNDLKYLK